MSPIWRNNGRKPANGRKAEIANWKSEARKRIGVRRGKQSPQSKFTVEHRRAKSGKISVWAAPDFRFHAPVHFLLHSTEVVAMVPSPLSVKTEARQPVDALPPLAGYVRGCLLGIALGLSVIFGIAWYLKPYDDQGQPYLWRRTSSSVCRSVRSRASPECLAHPAG